MTELASQVRNYSSVAAEYYDADMHPTCANFRRAGELLIERWRPFLEHVRRDQIIEVGAGKSQVADLLAAEGLRLDNLMISDECEEMLEHSDSFRDLGASLVECNAREIPVPDDSVRVLVALLADPYNDSEFWAEAKRVLAPGGIVIATFPSFEWASAFRCEGMHDMAEFETATGPVFLPSMIMDVPSQIELICTAGFRTLEVEHVATQRLGMHLSAKLTTGRGPIEHVLSGFLAIAS
jgi:ubiquinone/menaquinone biosynthesis C-methylase UbiE